MLCHLEWILADGMGDLYEACLRHGIIGAARTEFSILLFYWSLQSCTTSVLQRDCHWFIAYQSHEDNTNMMIMMNSLDNTMNSGEMWRKSTYQSSIVEVCHTGHMSHLLLMYHVEYDHSTYFSEYISRSTSAHLCKPHQCLDWACSNQCSVQCLWVNYSAREACRRYNDLTYSYIWRD